MSLSFTKWNSVKKSWGVIYGWWMEKVLFFFSESCAIFRSLIKINGSLALLTNYGKRIN